MSTSTDYVLGTHDDELARLGLQHRAWQSATQAAWKSAGILPGHTVLDVGCGPGYATLDLANLVGTDGRIIALDKSDKFLKFLEAQSRQSGMENITLQRMDLEDAAFPEVVADAAWCRWVFAFLKNPQDMVGRLAAGIRPGGVIVIHEYFDYAAWRMLPPCPELQEFVGCVIASWRENGGEPDIALSLPSWLENLGFEIRSLRPIVDVVQTGQPKWQWMSSFLEIGRRRLVDLGYLSAARSESILQAFRALESHPGTRMVTPAVLEIIAERPSQSA